MVLLVGIAVFVYLNPV